MKASLVRMRRLSEKLLREREKVQRADNELKIPDDWATFAQTLMVRSGGDLKSFNPYDYQKKLVNLMLERSVIVAKSRQLGISETVLSYILWQAARNPGYLALVFSKNQNDSSLLARRLRRMLESINLKTVTENLGDVEIRGGGRVLFRNSRPDSARGLESVCDIFYDEFSFLENAKQVFDAASPSQQMLGERARIFLVSTPNGRANYYWELLNSNNDNRDVETICREMSEGRREPLQYWIDSGGWGKIILHWKVHPIYGTNENFLKEIHEKQKLSLSTIQQEYDLSFTESETAVFNYELVQNGIGEVLEETAPDTKSRYYLGVDASTTGSDYTAAVLLKEKNNRYSVVKIYRKRQQTSEYHLFQIGEIIKKFTPDVVGIETVGGTGQVWLEQLSRIFPGIQFEAIKTSGNTKPAMVATVMLALEKGILQYSSNSILIEELLSFRRIGKKLEASLNKHDDTVLALCFSLAVSQFNKENKSIFDLSKLRIE